MLRFLPCTSLDTCMDKSWPVAFPLPSLPRWMSLQASPSCIIAPLHDQCFHSECTRERACMGHDFYGCDHTGAAGFFTRPYHVLVKIVFLLHLPLPLDEVHVKQSNINTKLKSPRTLPWSTICASHLKQGLFHLILLGLDWARKLHIVSRKCILQVTHQS